MSKSVSTIEEVKARSAGINVSDSLEIDDELLGALQLSSPGNKATEVDRASSRVDALDLLQKQMKSVKSSIYDFEDGVVDDPECQGLNAVLGGREAAELLEETVLVEEDYC